MTGPNVRLAADLVGLAQDVGNVTELAGCSSVGKRCDDHSKLPDLVLSFATSVPRRASVSLGTAGSPGKVQLPCPGSRFMLSRVR